MSDIAGQIVTLYPHPSEADVGCLNADPDVIAAIRRFPTAPVMTYAPSVPAYLINGGDMGSMIYGLKAHGAVVVSTWAQPDTERPPRGTGPLWCGECDERSRLAVVDADPLTLTRCPVCHPLRDQPLPGMTGRRGRDTTPPVDPEEYHRGLGTVRAELDRLRLGRTRDIRPGEPVLIGQLLEEGDDEAHPF